MKTKGIMKKTAIIMFAVIMVFSLTACQLFKPKLEAPEGGYRVFAVESYGYLVEADALEVASDLTMKRDGSGTVTMNGTEYAITWEAEDTDLIISTEDEIFYGYVEKGIVLLEYDEGIIYCYAKDGADTSGYDPMTAEEYVESGGAEMLVLMDGRNLYYALDGNDFDWNAALAAFQDAADSGSASAWYYIGKLYESTLEEGHFEKMKEAYETADAQGSLLGTYGLGRMYLYAKGVDPDFELAKKYFETAVEGGLAEANSGLGQMYDSGYGVEKDAAKALSYYSKALEGTEFGIVNSAMLSIGEIYLYGGTNVDPDEEKGKEYILEALDNEYSAAYASYGKMYDNGVGVEQDKDTAAEYFAEAGRRGSSNGYMHLGNQCLYADEPDYENAKGYYETAAWMGAGGALVNLGWMCEKGYAFEQNDSQAFSYYKTAADFGNKVGFYDVGVCYYVGRGVEKDYAKAMEYLKKAALYHYPDAQKMIGIMYARGEGVEKNETEAVKWLTLALENAGGDEELSAEIQEELNKIDVQQ